MGVYKFLAILSGITLALLIGLTIQEKVMDKNLMDKVKEQPQVAGLKIEYGDENVPLLTKKDFFENKLAKIIEDKSGTYSLAVKIIDEDFSVAVNENEIYYPASLYKIPIVMGILKNYEDGVIDLNKSIELKEEHITEGSGFLSEEEPGTKYKITDLLNYLIKQSDNTAQEMLIPVADFNLVYKLMEKDEGVTVSQMIRILDDIYNETYLESDTTAILVDLLVGTSFDDRIHDGLASNVKFAHKIGNWPETGTWHDCGIIFDDKDIVVCVLSKNTTYEEFREVSKEFGQLVSNYFDI